MQMLYVYILCASCGSDQCCILHDMPLLMLVEDARGDHLEELYSRAGLMTVLYKPWLSPSAYPIMLR